MRWMLASHHRTVSSDLLTAGVEVGCRGRAGCAVPTGFWATADFLTTGGSGFGADLPTSFRLGTLRACADMIDANDRRSSGISENTACSLIARTLSAGVRW